MFLEQHVRWEYMGLIDLDVSFFILAGIFLVFLFVMNSLLFKPLMGVFDERKKRTEGARDDATRDGAEARQMIATYEDKLSLAVAEGAEVRSELRSAALADSQARFAEARKEHTSRVAAGSKAARDEYDASRADVEKAAQPLARAIADKILGASGTK